ncbi:MAG: heavy metal translocating P-type ATPase [Lachnospiraceae bacterium]|jgi:Cu2+-exporting ATPase|nr:heavy metal translocating P-type ATPase [Lachnospiraceae bacterium]MEE3461828.1 heavy metal translocating P-type ATPase [Lachnospiraceae bacterium]
MDKYKVTGMSCAACQAHVEKAVKKVQGVSACTVSLLTNSMTVEGTASPADVMKAVYDAGYGASPLDAGMSGAGGSAGLYTEGHAGSMIKEKAGSGSFSAKIAAEEEALRDTETPKMKKRLFWSVGFLLILMYFSMGVHMWGWPVPTFMQGNHVAMGLVELLLSGIILVINQKFFVSGFKALFRLAPNMDSTIALGSGAAFIYSVVMLFKMTRAQTDGGSAAAAPYMNEFYFESAAMILTLITIGKTLEAYSKGQTTNALKSLMKIAPETADLIRDGNEVTVSIDEVAIGDIFVVRPGGNIPVDGIVLEGSSAVDESALTGESVPVDKEAGSTVKSGTINQSGFLTCRAVRVGEDTSLAQIIQMVSDAASTKAPVARLADTISAYFVPGVIIASLITFAVWMIGGNSFSGGEGILINTAVVSKALQHAITVLVVACPCALGLATPVAIMAGNGMGAKNGILFKTAEALQEAGNVQIVALDKTGTITNGTPVVTDIITAENVNEEQLLSKAKALESKSEHPLAKAVMEYGPENGSKYKSLDIKGFKALPGNGLEGSLDGRKLLGGSCRFISGRADIPADMMKAGEILAEDGKTPLYFSEDEKLIGIIAVADTIKKDSKEAVNELKKMGIHVVMLTGDNERTARAIGRQAGVDEVVADVLPDGKEEVIRRLQDKGLERYHAKGYLKDPDPDKAENDRKSITGRFRKAKKYKVAMVGDGINDAPALTRADIGIAIGAGTEAAIDAADVVLMNSTLSDVSAAVRLSRVTYKDIIENLFWAFFYNILLIPLAAGVYTKLGITMSPMWGALAMSLSSVFVCLNALRLNLFNMHSGRGDRPMKHRAVTCEGGSLLKENTLDKAGSLDDPQKSSDNNKSFHKSQEKENTMTKTINIEGMMCGHCEMTVKKALEALDGVESAQVSHEKGTAVVELSKDVKEADMTKAVEDKDYKVLSIA